eukprot:SAG22_NODE_87_length_21437_cov_14.162480_15_plen_61_part_00
MRSRSDRVNLSLLDTDLPAGKVMLSAQLFNLAKFEGELDDRHSQPGKVVRSFTALYTLLP